MSAVPNVHMTKKVSFTLFSYLFFLKLFHLQARQKCHWYRGGYRLWMWEKTLSISGTFFTCKYAVCHLNHSSMTIFWNIFFFMLVIFKKESLRLLLYFWLFSPGFHSFSYFQITISILTIGFICNSLHSNQHSYKIYDPTLSVLFWEFLI